MHTYMPKKVSHTALQTCTHVGFMDFPQVKEIADVENVYVKMTMKEQPVSA